MKNVYKIYSGKNNVRKLNTVLLINLSIADNTAVWIENIHFFVGGWLNSLSGFYLQVWQMLTFPRRFHRKVLNGKASSKVKEGIGCSQSLPKQITLIKLTSEKNKYFQELFYNQIQWHKVK